jgi:hypothetical protein
MMSRQENTYSVVEKIIGVPLKSLLMTPRGGIWVWNPRDPSLWGSWQVYRTRFDLTATSVPAWAEALRQDAEALLDSYPATKHQLIELGCDHVDILHTPIQTVDELVGWNNSIYNACYPVPAAPVPVQTLDSPESFAYAHKDSHGFLVVAPGTNKSTQVLWTQPPTQYSPGAILGPRHPVSLAAWSGKPLGGTK